MFSAEDDEKNIRTQESLKSFFETEIKPGLGMIEIKRLRFRKKRIRRHILFALLIPVTAGFFAWMIIDSYGESQFLTVLVFGCFFYLLIIPFIIFPWRFTIKNFNDPELKHQFKLAVISKIVRFISEDLIYSPEDRNVDFAEFDRSMIFPPSAITGSMTAEDRIEGLIGNTKILFYELGGGSDWSPFTGLFFFADFNKSFSGHTLVIPVKRSRLPAWWKASGREPVSMDDPGFAKFFEVYSTDQVTARYILSMSLMKRIAGYRKNINRDFYLSFIRGRIYIFILYGKNILEIDPYRSVYDFECIREYYNDMKFAMELVDDLNLNTRIWLMDEKKTDEMETIDVIPGNQKKRKTFIWLAVLLGMSGAHYFYAGYRGRGLLHFPMLPLLYLSFTGGNDVLIFTAVVILILLWPLGVFLEISLTPYDSSGKPMI